MMVFLTTFELFLSTDNLFSFVRCTIYARVTHARAICARVIYAQ